MYVITNGRVILENEIIEGHTVVVKGDTIIDIRRENDISEYKQFTKIDANGGYIAPGFVDIHSDYIETIVSPRPTAMMDFNMGIREAERILVSHGITTMFHSLSIYKDDGFSNKPIRRPENVNRLIDEISKTHMNEHIIRHRVHARLEIDNIEQVDTFMKNMADEKVHLISFMDHTPGQGQYRNLEIYKDTIKGYRSLSDKEIDHLILQGMTKQKITFDQMKQISDLALTKNIAVASHDDDEIEKLSLVKSLGTTISEFPTTLSVAKAAKELGLWTIAGAPNVVLGGSHSGNLCATEAIREQSIDILCSDYYPPSLLHAVFRLHEAKGHDLVEMFKLVTINPAKAVRMDDLIGSIQIGKKADLLIIEKLADEFPIVTTTMVDGKRMTTTNYRQKEKVLSHV